MTYKICQVKNERVLLMLIIHLKIILRRHLGQTLHTCSSLSSGELGAIQQNLMRICLYLRDLLTKSAVDCRQHTLSAFQHSPGWAVILRMNFKTVQTLIACFNPSRQGRSFQVKPLYSLQSHKVSLNLSRGGRSFRVFNTN